MNSRNEKRQLKET